MNPLSVCLIVPPSVFLLDERVFPFLGILKVAAALEARGVAVDVLDLSGIENYEEVTRTYAARSDARHFGVTATTPQMPAARKIAAAIRSVRADAALILGGPHATLVNAAARSEESRLVRGRAVQAREIICAAFDVVVAGDGERAVFEALQPSPPRLIDADEPASPLFLDKQALTAAPFPARHLIDLDSYRYAIDGERATSLIAQLGCPFECGFCGGRLSPFLRRVRMRSADNVVDEMIALYRGYGIKGFMMYDDELNVNKGIVALMGAIRAAQDRLGVEWRCRGFIKAELFTDEQAAAMHAAGFRWILTGFESGSPRILENINKRATRDDNTRCLEIARRHGLKVKALMSVGHPGESEDTVRDTYDWLLSVAPDDFDVSVITTYPGSPYYDQALPASDGSWVYTYARTGDRLYSRDVDFTETAEYYKGRPGEYVSYVWTEHLASEQLVGLRDRLEHDVRERLQLPFNASASAVRYEHSMGQGLPGYILRRTSANGPPCADDAVTAGAGIPSCATNDGMPGQFR